MDIPVFKGHLVLAHKERSVRVTGENVIVINLEQ